MFININISSKDFNSLNLFLVFFIKILISKKLKIKNFEKVKPVTAKKKSFTVLKSPHVNKTAQEQFKYDIFSYNIRLQPFQLLKLVFILKNINANTHTNINISFKLFYNDKNFKQKRLKSFDTNNYSVNIKNYSNYWVKNYLEILSFYGEKKFKKMCCLNSSAGRAKD